MRPIDQIIICCYARDVWLTRICVASIRYWCPDVTVGLLKDLSAGDFDTSEIESTWNVSIWGQPDPPLGSMSQLEPHFAPAGQRFFVIDSDIIFLGPVMELLEACDADFVVNAMQMWELPEPAREAYAIQNYFHLPTLRRLFPGYTCPDLLFNAGQIVVTTGRMKREDFAPYLTDTLPIKPKSPEVFRHDAQGLINFLLTNKSREKLITLSHCDFVKWPDHQSTHLLLLEKLVDRTGYPFIMHWAGLKPFFRSGFVGGDLMAFYEDYYYSMTPGGTALREERLRQRFDVYCEGIGTRGIRVCEMSGFRPCFDALRRNERNPTRSGNNTAFLKRWSEKEGRNLPQRA